MMTLNLTKKDDESLPKTQQNEKTENKTPTKKAFYKDFIFWLSGILLFFYLGLENCVNGWFVTYFKNTGIMSESFSINLASFTWLAVLFGRLFTAFISSKVKKQTIILFECLATAFFFILLISTHNLIAITTAIIGLGFFFAGIYPTTVANAGSAIKNSDFGTSMLLAISALGGIITPQIVGIIADKAGMAGAIATLLVNTTVMIVLAVLNYLRSRKEN